MRIAYLTLGCKLNYAETDTYRRGFTAAGWETVPWEEAADVYLVNTCSVTTHAENKCRNIIRKCHRTNPQAAIVVTGCYAELRREEVAALEGVVQVFGAQEKRRVVPETIRLATAGSGAPEALAEVHAAGNAPGISAAEADPRSDMMPAWSGGRRTRAFLKVQDGCNNYCAYCTVPFARGASRNLPVADLVDQARDIAAQGIREIVLTGVNTGDFGRTTGESFLDLLRALDGVDGICRYRISSIEPNLITPDIIGWIASGTKFLPHFHIPLQTGSDELLRAMGRRYDTALFASRIEAVRAAMEGPGKPLVFFGIDVIAGLPGETEERFQETYRFLKERIRPAFLHIFPYSPRPGTRAAAMPGQVQDRIKTARVKALEALSDRLYAAFVEANRGLPEEVLWESANHDGMMSGYTRNYIRIDAPYDATRIGTIETVTL